MGVGVSTGLALGIGLGVGLGTGIGAGTGTAGTGAAGAAGVAGVAALAAQGLLRPRPAKLAKERHEVVDTCGNLMPVEVWFRKIFVANEANG